LLHILPVLLDDRCDKQIWYWLKRFFEINFIFITLNRNPNFVKELPDRAIAEASNKFPTGRLAHVG
jgi:hypothetical protein